MNISNDILVYKAFPDDDNPLGYLPIDGSLIRTGDVIYLEVLPPTGYGVAQIKANGTPITPFPDVVEGRYRIIVNDCTDTYTVVFGRIQHLEISVTQSDVATYEAIF